MSAAHNASRVFLDAQSQAAILSHVEAARSSGWTTEDLRCFFAAEGVTPGYAAKACRGEPIDEPSRQALVRISIVGLPDRPTMSDALTPALAELRARPQWVAWRYKPRPGQKPTKPPVNPHTGLGASHSDPSTWGTYEEARGRADKDGLPGVGYVLSDSDDFTGIDLDGCRDDATGDLAPWAQGIVDLAETYTEVSPSGTGLRLIARGKVDAALKCDPASVEVYGTARYLTITGRHVSGTPTAINAAPQTLAALQERVTEFRPRKDHHSEPTPKPGKQRDSRDPFGFGSEPNPFWRNVNEAALADLGSWVPALFPAAVYQPGTRGYRVSSHALGRDLQEDLSITPRGIVDWGTADMGHPNDGKYSPIGLVADFNDMDAVDAAHWLCERLGKRPSEFGWKEAAGRTDEPARGEAGGDSAAKSADSQKPQKATNALTLHRMMRTHTALIGLVGYDEFNNSPTLLKPMPGRQASNQPFTPRPWQDEDDTRLAIWFQANGHPKASDRLAYQVMRVVADENKFHPVRDYFDGLQWDSEPRLSDWLRRYAGAVIEDDEHRLYVEAVSRAVLVGAVARTYQPGCKVDTMLILEGPQGALKSSLLRTICPRPEWFSDTLTTNLDDKDARQGLAGNLILELPEISAFKKSDVEILKAFLTASVDKYRPSYGRAVGTFPRQSILIGTTNDQGYLTDVTGNRRFWPVRVTRVDLDAARGSRDQLWAEAVAAYRSGEKWWLADDAAQRAAKEQAERLDGDEWSRPVEEHLRFKAGGVEVSDILQSVFDINRRDIQKSHQMRVAAILRALGYERRKVRVAAAGVTAWHWFKGDR